MVTPSTASVIGEFDGLRPTSDRCSAPARQQLRLGVVLTGGVSLAVWMGGVVTEIQRLAERRDVYRRLCDLTSTDVLVDVIGGSSAGGVNGAILAMALCRATDASQVRDVWVERAALSDLLREQTDAPHASLLRGDGYFLPQLRALFDRLDGPLVHPVRQPMEVILTGTLLDGVSQQRSDDFGSSFTDTNHRAEFRFRRGAHCPRDDFADSAVPSKLALAARATSSFPGAFEPTFCPVGGAAAEVDLAGHVNFGSSAYVIDGGVLVNKPLRPVLDTVIARRDEANVRRVIAYVQPAPDQDELYGTETLPGAGRVLQAGLLSLPHAESLARELGELGDYNARVVRRREALRTQLTVPPADVVLAAQHLLAEYTALQVADQPGGRADGHTLGPVDRHGADEADGRARRLPASPADFDRWRWSVDELRHGLDVLEMISAGLRSSLDRDTAVAIDRLRFELARAEAGGAHRSSRWFDALHTDIADLVVRLQPTLFSDGPGRTLACRQWLLASAVIHGVSASGRMTGSVPIEMLHISAEAPNALDDRSRPSQKLAGLQLQHFGAFYRSTWRANDWMWGRIDATTRLVQMILAPRRLHELAAGDATFLARCQDVLDDLAAGREAHLPPDWRERVADELAALDGPADELPGRFATVVRVVCTGLHLNIASEELPRIAERARADLVAGHNLPDSSRALLDTPCGPLTDDAARAAFAGCRVGEERLADDIGSPAYEHFLDRLTRLVLHTGSPAQPRASRAARLVSRPTPPVWRAAQRAALLSRWPLVIVSSALIAGAILVTSAASMTAAMTAAVVIGGLLLLAGAAGASLLARRVSRMLIAAAACLAVCLVLAMAGPWVWRGWLLLACATDLTLSVRRARRLRLRPTESTGRS